MTRLEYALAAASETKALRIGSGILSQVADLFREQFSDAPALVVADRNTFAAAGEAVHGFLSAAGIPCESPFVFDDPDIYAEYSYVDSLVARLRETAAIPVAVGSGTINDLSKLSAHLCGRSYLCVGTAASMDGYTAYGASITAQGAKQTFTCPAPRAVLADLEVMRRVPAEMTASGYADLFAKVPAGADWILADALGIEPIDAQAWEIVQGGLSEALCDPAGIRKGEPGPLGAFVEGLMLGGFAMQWTRTSRPASGAEHQFSHLWNMEHHTYRGEPVSHGFQVAVATLTMTLLYEQLLKSSIDTLDVEACCERWPSESEMAAEVEKVFAGSEFLEVPLRETLVKYIPAGELRVQLNLLKDRWGDIQNRLRAQLVPSEEVVRRFMEVGAPISPEQIGLTREALRDTVVRAQYLRRRFTLLDVGVRTGLLEEWLDAIFGEKGPWKTA